MRHHRLRRPWAGMTGHHDQAAAGGRRLSQMTGSHADACTKIPACDDRYANASSPCHGRSNESYRWSIDTSDTITVSRLGRHNSSGIRTSRCHDVTTACFATANRLFIHAQLNVKTRHKIQHTDIEIVCRLIDKCVTFKYTKKTRQ